MPKQNSNYSGNGENPAGRELTDLTTRAVSLSPSTFDEKTGSVSAVATTEKPTRVFDYSRYEYVDEILRMDGCILPASGRVPLLDCHSRWGVKDVLGSAGDFKMSEAGGLRALECVVTYSGTDEGSSAAQKTKEGHLTDYSVGYRVNEKSAYWIPEGQKQIINGDEYEGPVKVVTSWELKELSATPIGADEYAKARSEHINILKREGNMPGANTNTNTNNNNPGSDPGRQTAPAQGQPPQEPGQRADGGEVVLATQPAAATVDVEKVRQQEREAERARITTIQQRCTVAGMEQTSIDDFIRRELPLDEVSNEIFKHLEARSSSVGLGRYYDVGQEDGEKYRAAAIDGMAFRAGLRPEKPAAGFDEFRHMSLIRLAEDCAARMGINVRGVRPLDLAGAVLGMSTLLGRSVSSASTSDFPLILSAIANKRLARAYQDARTTWRTFCNIVEARDFKYIESLNVSALSVLDLIREDGEYKKKKMSENRERYLVKTYGNTFSLSRQMIVNDDLRVFQTIPAKFGAAAARTINRLVYTLLNSNPTMSDGIPLFHADHGNLVSLEAALGGPSAEALSEMRRLMRLQTDIGDNTELNLNLNSVAIPTKHETNLALILASTALPTANMSSGVANEWQGSLSTAIDATLDGMDSDAWYAFPETSAADTIEVSFLDGVEAPFIDSMVDFDTDGLTYKCRLDVGVGVVGHHIIKNPGK